MPPIELPNVDAVRESGGRADNERPEAYITGLGLVTPIGVGRKEFWNSLLASKSGIGPITLFDPEGFDVKIAAECTDFEPTDFMDRKAIQRTDRFTQFALASTLMAMDDAGAYGFLEKSPERVGIVLGTALGGMASLEHTQYTIDQKGPERVNPFTVPKIMYNAAAACIGINLGVRGPSTAPGLACSCGTDAMGIGFDLIRRGDADMVICGGADATVTPVIMAGFMTMRALSRRNGDPSGACRPYDRDHSGFVMGEGGAVVILESAESVIRRGREPYAKITGIGRTTDARHLTEPNPEGAGILRAMQLALHGAGLDGQQVDYINPHGTGTVAGDGPESWAMHSVNPRVQVSATKSTLGHSLGACGAIETAICALSLKEQTVPPMRNLDELAEDCAPLDYVVDKACPTSDMEVVLSTNLAFGGHNTSIVLEKAH